MIGGKIYTYHHADPGEYNQTKRQMKQAEKREWLKEVNNEFVEYIDQHIEYVENSVSNEEEIKMAYYYKRRQNVGRNLRK